MILESFTDTHGAGKILRHLRGMSPAEFQQGGALSYFSFHTVTRCLLHDVHFVVYLVSHFFIFLYFSSGSLKCPQSIRLSSVSNLKKAGMHLTA